MPQNGNPCRGTAAQAADPHFRVTARRPSQEDEAAQESPLLHELLLEERLEGRRRSTRGRTNAGLALADRPPRFRFQVDAAGTLHLMHDGFPVGIAARESEQLPVVLTALADLRVRPQALAHFLLAVPDEVLRRCGVILAEMAGAG